MDKSERDARINLAAALREGARLGWQDSVCQHFSLMLEGSPNRYLVNPAGLYWSEITASDLIVVVEGEPAAEIDEVADVAVNIHGPIHRNHPAAKCVLHAHPLNATALSMVEGGRLEPVYQDGLRFFERIAYDENYSGLAEDESEGDRMAAILGDNRALLLANHGVVATGPTVAHAFDDLYFLERSAQAQLAAMQIGLPLRSVSREVALLTRDQEDRQRDLVANMHFEAVLRRLRREEPEFES